MKKYYLRLYGAMANQPDSEASAALRNSVIKECVRELKAQGLDIESLEFGSGKLVLHDENCIPLSNSCVSRFFRTMNIKVHRRIWEIKQYFHKKRSKV